MQTLEQALKTLTKDNKKLYSEAATVVQTYRKKDTDSLGIDYDKFKHVLCDVRLIRDGSILYDVSLSPIVLADTDIVVDGSEDSTSSGNVRVDVPLIGSYVYITYLDEENAFVSLSTSTESIIIGSPSGAYMDLYVKDESRIIDLVNCDEFKIQLNNGKTFNMKLDKDTNLSEFILLMDTIRLTTTDSSLLMSRDDDNNPFIEFAIAGDGTFKMANDTINFKDILLDIISTFNDYLTGVQPGLTTAGYTIPPAIFSTLSDLELRINQLFS